MRLLLQVLGLIAVPNFIVGVRFPGCSSGRLAVDETSNKEVTCDQFDASVIVGWYLKPQSGEKIVTLGTCPPNGGCQQGTPHNLTRSSTRSTVTFSQSSNIRLIGTTYMIQCGIVNGATTSCALDVFYPSEVQNCQVEARSESWTFNGSCNITKTFSSSNHYECKVFRGTSQSSQPSPVTSVNYMVLSHSDANYSTGSCSFSSVFTSLLSGITSRQDFYFKIDVYPGPIPRVVGPVTLEKPVSPTIRCPEIVAENTNFTCTCSTTNLGLPAGSLVWSRVTDGTIKEGPYDVTTLTLPSQTLTRRDQGVEKFRCKVRWAAGTYMAVYTGNIGFPPSQTGLKVNSVTPGQTMTVSENDDVSFNCTATDGNPKSTLTLLKAKSTITTGSSPLIHSLGKAQCQHSDNYTCTAKNTYGDSVTSSVNLYVNCLPRTSMKIPALNFIDKKDEITFPVTAYPVPTLNVLYIGKSESTPGSPAELPDSIKMNGSCEAVGGMIHQSTCTITVYNVTSNEAAGFYQVTLTNTPGNINTTFEIKYKAPVSRSQESPLGNAAVIGGVIGAVVVGGIIAVVVVIVLKRRKGHEKEHSNSTAASRPQNGQGRNSSSLADADPEAPSRPLSFAPMPVYAQVDKTKKSNQEAASPEAEANGVVYAEVDKTKKKQAPDASSTKPKTGAKAAGNPKKDKKKKDKRDEAAHVYGNVKDVKRAKAKKTTPAKEETSSGKMVNPEGLIYTSVEFSQPPKSGKPAPKKPEEEAVVYSAVDFKKSPPAP